MNESDLREQPDQQAHGVFAPGSACDIKLQIFEGPLDLLLHLIQKNEVQITDIPVAEIARQYTEYLELMGELNLEVAGEYLVMAAMLTWIKSRMILPRPEGEDGEEGDPRAELVARLLEYQRYRGAAETLGERTLEGRDVFAAVSPAPEKTPDAEREIRVSLVELLEAFRNVLMSAAPAGRGPHEIETETVTVHECMALVMNLLETRGALEFERLFERDDGKAPSRPRVIATFLAILELARLSALNIFQSVDENHCPVGPIRLRRSHAQGVDWNQAAPA